MYSSFIIKIIMNNNAISPNVGYNIVNSVLKFNLLINIHKTQIINTKLLYLTLIDDCSLFANPNKLLTIVVNISSHRINIKQYLIKSLKGSTI